MVSVIERYFGGKNPKPPKEPEIPVKREQSWGGEEGGAPIPRKGNSLVNSLPAEPWLSGVSVSCVCDVCLCLRGAVS